MGNDDQWNNGAPELYMGYGTGGLATFNHDEGSVYVTRHVYIGYETGSSATYDLQDGWLETGCYDARSTDGDLYVGRKGSGTLTQSGGYIFLDPPAGTKEGRLHVGGDGGDNTVNGVGVYNLSGGTCEVRSAVHIGSGGTGTVTQTGGRLKVLSGEYKHRMSIGQKNGKGVYNLYGGTLDLVRYGGYSLGLHVAGGWPDGNAIGELNIGNASGAGSLVETTAGDGMYLLVRQFDTDRATVRGWSDDGANRFQLTGILYNSGRIIADGYGTQRSLNLSTMSSVTNSSGVSDNTSSNGWFAQDKGKLILPGISVSEGNTYNWGEASDDASIDMVNSARITFNQLSAGPTTLTGSLLATDRSDVPAGPVSLISVHEFSLSGGATSSDFDITIRYDDAAAGTEEADLKLFHYAGGKWVDTEATLNAGNNWITATNLASFSQFGVGFDQAGGTMFKIR